MTLVALLACSEPQTVPVTPPASQPKRKPSVRPPDPTLLAIIDSVFAHHKVTLNRPVYLALAHLESNFSVDEVSPAGAVGLFQIMTVTALSILEAHPNFDPKQTSIYNPVLKNEKPLLHRGTAERYPFRVMRIYAAHLRRTRDTHRVRLNRPRQYLEVMRGLDVRFDPHTNTRMAVYHLEQLRRGYFNRQRCYRYRGSDEAHRGKKLCGRFTGRHATLLTAASYHLGIGAVENMLAVSQARSIRQYVESLRKARDPIYRRNRYYIAKLQRLSRTYASLLKQGPLTRERMTRAFPGQPALARRLFLRFPVSPSK